MAKKDFLQIFREADAVLKGHFQLSSGLHSDTYIQCAKIFEQPYIAKEICKELATSWKGKKIDVVAGPSYGGIILSYELAQQLGCRSVFLERVDGKFTLRREFKIESGDKILAAEDVVTTGGSIKEVIEVIKSLGGEIVGVTSLVNRSKEQIFREEFHSIITLVPPTYKPELCPLCKDGKPITKPGSRGQK